MEGYHIDDNSIQHCKELLENKVSLEEYMHIAKQKINTISLDE